MAPLPVVVSVAVLVLTRCTLHYHGRDTLVLPAVQQLLLCTRLQVTLLPHQVSWHPAELRGRPSAGPAACATDVAYMLCYPCGHTRCCAACVPPAVLLPCFLDMLPSGFTAGQLASCSAAGVPVGEVLLPLHLSEQYFTSSHTFSHFFRHVNGRPQQRQTLLGRSDLLGALDLLPEPFFVNCGEHRWIIGEAVLGVQHGCS